MHLSKQRGGKRATTSSVIAHDRPQRLILREDLRRAIHQGELAVHFQPQIRLSDGHVCAFEALARWPRTEHPWVPPGVFVPLAETNSLIGSLGEWVLREACRQQVRWRDRGFGDFVVAVNVSPKQFALSNMDEAIRQVLHDTGIAPSRLCLEITEGLLVQDAPATLATLNAIRTLGVEVAIDDFGTGYSSLAYFNMFSPTQIKLDRSFIDSTLNNRQAQGLIGGIIHLAHGLGIPVVAEGMETVRQCKQLRKLRCDYGQGYFFSRPLPALDIESWMMNSDVKWHS